MGLLNFVLGIMLMAEAPAATASPTPAPATADASPSPKPASVATDPLEAEFQELLKADDLAQAETAKMIEATENPKDPANAPLPLTLKARLDQRFKPVEQRYEEFLSKHPGHARAHLAFGSFLNDLGREDDAISHYEKAKELDPKNPAAWNNLAGIYAHHGPVAKSFPYYEEAIRLNPNEASYLHSFGTLIFLFRTEATNYFKCDEQTVFSRALENYHQAMRLDPGNFDLAQDVAQTFYGIKSPPAATAEQKKSAELNLCRQALGAWTNAFLLADDSLRREGIYLHYARWNIRAGQWEDAKLNLASVTNDVLLDVKARIAKNLVRPVMTNSLPGLPAPPPSTNSPAP
jgi:tetratricopeptide (TPR) repeat protein